MKIGVKITCTFFLIAFLSMAVISVISYLRAKESLEKQSFEKLTAVREMKAGQIEDYFQIITDQIITKAEDPTIINALKDFKTGFNSIEKELNANAKSAYQKVQTYIEREYLPQLKDTAQQHLFITGKGNSLLLQDLYYASNPHATGKKHELIHAGDKSSYTLAHAKYHPGIKRFLEKFGYYDIFLIDDAGNIVYSVFKEVDFATSLTNGPFKKTNLANAFNAANASVNKEFTRIVDFMPYLPSYNAEASFIACPVFDGDVKIGVLAFQMPIDRINSIMTNKQDWFKMGLGKSGETYIVGNNYTIRNQSRFLIEDSTNYFKMLNAIGTDTHTIENIRTFNSSIGLQQVKTEGSTAALSGQTDTRIFSDYRGVSVLSAYKPLNIKDMHWAIMSEIDEAEAFENTVVLRKNISIAFVILLFFVFIVSYFVSREITKPLKELTYDAEELANGNLEVEIKTGKKDEIGLLAKSFKKMQTSINHLISDLRHINHNLEEKVIERTEEIVTQKNIIQEKQKEIVDSILYAKRIQETILAKDNYLQKYLNEYFVLFKPKDIVSGDFYWATSKKSSNGNSLTEDKFYLMVCDSTGHGVPGAFMSLLNISFLNEAINNKGITEPNEILNHVRKRLIKNISNDGAQDGMDGIVVCFDRIKNTISYSSAHNAPIIVRNNQIIEYKADKMPVGIGVRNESFTLHEIEFRTGDILYMYTDGYADQFGGPKGKKFKYKTLNALLAGISEKPLPEQQQILLHTFEDWKGTLEQIDDVCVFAVKL